MIIWTGRGILMPFVAAATGAVGALIAAGIESGLGLTGGSLTVPLGAIGAASGLWLFALTPLGRTQKQILVDPQTRQNVVLSRSHTLYFIPPIAWAVLGSMCAVISIPVTVIGLHAERQAAAEEARTPGLAEAHQAFDAANSKLGSYSGGEAFGNSIDAQIAASKFARTLKKLRDLTINTSKSTLSSSRDRFLTHCQLKGDTCLFLVQIPDLRKYDGDAKDAIASMAWIDAVKEASQFEPRPAKVAVAIRGMALYDRLLSGALPSTEGPTPDKPGHSVISPSGDQMYSYFMPSTGNLPKYKPAAPATAPAPVVETKL